MTGNLPQLKAFFSEMMARSDEGLWPEDVHADVMGYLKAARPSDLLDFGERILVHALNNKRRFIQEIGHEK